jgi:DNA (cytosine-5)-methyltransferase 1
VAGGGRKVTDVDSPSIIRVASFFSGAGGLDLAVRIALPSARTVLYVENEITACEVLAANIASGAHHDAPIWTDIKTFRGAEWRGSVDSIVAGFPCPDYSVAGKRAGKIGKHGQLWDYLAIAIRDMGPVVVQLENVPGILVPHGASDSEWVLPAGLHFVLGDLAEMGFDAEWGCIRASDVGASHQRLRWFCVAYRKGGGFRELRESSERSGLIGGGGGGNEGMAEPKHT